MDYNTVANTMEHKTHIKDVPKNQGTPETYYSINYEININTLNPDALLKIKYLLDEINKEILKNGNYINVDYMRRNQSENTRYKY